MKRLFIPLLLALVAVTAQATSNTPAASDTGNVRYTLTIAQNGRQVSKIEVFATPGAITPIAVEQQQAYIQGACKQGADGITTTVGRGQTTTSGSQSVATDPAPGCAKAPGATVTKDGVTLTPGTVTSGLNVRMETYRHSDQVHVELSLVQVLKINTITQGDLTIQTPQTAQIRLDQHVSVAPHQTITLAQGEPAGLVITLARQ